MAYFCPRDKKNLLWRDFLDTGRWFCRSCSGSLAFEKNLQKLPSYKAFQQALTPISTEQHFVCPVCAQKMARYQLPHQGQVVEIDQCSNCKSFWFDPGEDKRLATTDFKIKPKSISEIHSVHNEYILQQKRWLRNIRYGIALVFAFIAFKNWQWVQNYHAADQFQSMCMGLRCTSWSQPYIYCAFASITFIIGRPILMLIGIFLGFSGTLVGLARL